MAKPALESLALHLPRAAAAALASSSAAGRRTVSSSAAGYVLEVYASDAALRVSAASAARRAADHAVACAVSSASTDLLLQAPCACESATIEAPRLPSSSAAAADRGAFDRVASSPPAPRPSSSSVSFIVSLHAVDWVRAALDPNTVSAAARGDADYFAYPSSTASSALLLPSFMAPLLPTAAAARAAANLSALVTFIPASSSGLGLLVPGESEATIAAMLPAPFTPIGFIVKGAGAARPRFFPSMWRLVDKATSMTALRVSGLRSDASRTWHGFHSSSSSPDSEEPVTPPPSYPTDNDLITLMNLTDLNMEEEVLFRRAFNERYQNFRIADVGDYLDNQKWTFEELRYILKIMYRKAGPHRQLMELLIREDMLHGYARAKRNSMRILY